jgi:hypothetical protein
MECTVYASGTYPIIKAAAVLIHLPSPSGFFGILDSSKSNVGSAGGAGGGAEAESEDMNLGLGPERVLQRLRDADGVLEFPDRMS